MRQIISDAVVKTKAEPKWAPTASDHITHHASDHLAWGQIVALVTHMAPLRPTAKSCCTRLAQRAEDSGWGLLGWRLCPNCATEGSSSHCRKPQVAMARLPGSCHLVNPCPTKGYQAGFVLSPLVKQVTTVLSLVLLWHVQDLPSSFFLWSIQAYY